MFAKKAMAIFPHILLKTDFIRAKSVENRNFQSFSQI